MKLLKTTLFLVLIGLQFLAQSQTIQINGSVANALTNEPIVGQDVYLFVPVTLDSVFTQTNEEGVFSVSVTLPEIDSSGVDVMTYDYCSQTMLHLRVYGWEENPMVTFYVCGDTTPLVNCQASFGYAEANQDSTVNADSSDWQPNTIRFYDYSWGNPQQWAWDFGDGSSSDLQNPVHQYADTGLYNVTLTINSQDCNSSTTAQVYVGTRPYDTVPEVYCQASFGYWAVNPNDTIYNDSIATYPAYSVYFYDYSWGNPTEWTWDFGDGYSSNEQYPVHQYAGPGNYVVNLSIVTPTCQSSFASLVFVGTNPVDTIPYIEYMAMFYPVIEPDLTVTFINQSIGNLTNYTWDFGDGSTSVEMYPVHKYAAAGDYIVTLKAFANDSLADIYEMMIGVGYSGTDSTPNAYFIPVFDGLNVSFFEISPYNVVSRNWNFGDGNTSNQQDPTNQYPYLGLFDVTLKADGFSGTSTSFTMRIDLANQTYSGFFNSSDALKVNDRSVNSIVPLIAPNPVNEMAIINFSSAYNELVNIEVCNLAGQTLFVQSFHSTNGDNHQILNTSELNNGIYVVKLKSDHQQYKAVLITK